MLLIYKKAKDSVSKLIRKMKHNDQRPATRKEEKADYAELLAEHSPYEINSIVWEIIRQRDFFLDKKVYINVPYAEKESAKALGARWDNLKKSWFISGNIKINLFWRWLSTIAEPDENTNIRSFGFFIAQSYRDCWRCKKSTQVFSFILPKHHQTKDYDEDDNPYWESFGEHSFVSYPGPINNSAIACMQSFSTKYYLDTTSAGGSYYMNHCEFCNSKLGDFYTHDEPDGGFWYGSKTSKIKLHWFDELFEASAGGFTQGVSGIDFLMCSVNHTVNHCPGKSFLLNFK